MGALVQQLLEVLAGDVSRSRDSVVGDRDSPVVDLAGPKRVRTGSGSDRINARLRRRLGFDRDLLIRPLSRRVGILTPYLFKIAACGLKVTRCQRDQVWTGSLNKRMKAVSIYIFSGVGHSRRTIGLKEA